MSKKKAAFRRFHIVREDDTVGITGEGVICEGVQWSDETCTTTYLTGVTSRTHWADGVRALEKTLLNSKVGTTRLVWLDAAEA